MAILPLWTPEARKPNFSCPKLMHYHEAIIAIAERGSCR